MNFKTTLFGFCILLASCKSQTNDNESALKDLNDRSLKCIAIMNNADALKNAAMAIGNREEIAVQQKRMDSAALENATIGQQMMQLQSK